MPRRTTTGPKPTRLQREERRNQRLGNPPPAGVQIKKSKESNSFKKSKALNDILDALQSTVPAFSKRSRLNSEPDVDLCLECIPDSKARKYLQKYGGNIDWDAPFGSDYEESDYED